MLCVHEGGDVALGYLEDPGGKARDAESLRPRVRDLKGDSLLQGRETGRREGRGVLGVSKGKREGRLGAGLAQPRPREL